MDLKDVKFDCKFFKGSIPCLPNKLRGKVCTCDEYIPISKQILIIKLGAIGDVIRTTPLAVKFKKEFPNCIITWLTQFPIVLPKDLVDNIRKFDLPAVLAVKNTKFDIAVNLDKETEACSLLSEVSAKQKYGFTWKNGHIDAATKSAEHKLITGLFDNFSKENTKSYQQEIFEICERKFDYEPSVLPVNETFKNKWSILREKANGKIIVGLNTGCGERWLTRLWPEEYWIELINKLNNEGFFSVLLGGEQEDKQNQKYAKTGKAFYPGHFSLEEFIGLTANTDIIVSAVSMMMHIALGLGKPLVLFNNIFNRNEFELYGNGIILEPSTACDDYYGHTCTRNRHCMLDISPEETLDSVIKALKKTE